MELPKLRLRIAFVEANGFQLELIEFQKSISYEAIQKRVPSVDDRTKIQGHGRIAFPRGVAASLKTNNVRFLRDIWRQGDRTTLVHRK
jgi:hypothetical protein